MMLPLVADVPDDHWPNALGITFDDGTQVTGQVIWIHAQAPAIRRGPRWTDEASGLCVRAIGPDDDPSGSVSGAAYLAVRLPADGDGPLMLADHVLHPVWRDVRPTPDPAFAAAPLEPAAGSDRPDPDSPFEYWRWVLLAEELDRSPPLPSRYGETGSLVAEHYADLWQIGLQRLAEHSPGVADACRDALTRICRDRETAFAAWVADPARLGTLLAVLLDFGRPAQALVSDALAWVDARPPLLLWPEGAAGEQVRLAIVNRTRKPLVARLQWDVSADVPIAVELAPGVLTPVIADRAPLPPSPLVGGPPEEAPRQNLRVTAGTQTVDLPFGKRRLAPVAPGVFIGPFQAPLTLAEIDAYARRPVRAEHATAAHLRRLNRRWEVFFECRRPDHGAQPDRIAADDRLQRCSDWRAARGVEAITLLIGPDDNPSIALTVPEHGWKALFRGADDGTLEIHRRSYRDRWHCRIVLPDSWLGTTNAAEMLTGFLRTHGDSGAVETAPETSAPWRQRPSRLALDPTAWRDLP